MIIYNKEISNKITGLLGEEDLEILHFWVSSSSEMAKNIDRKYFVQHVPLKLEVLIVYFVFRNTLVFMCGEKIIMCKSQKRLDSRDYMSSIV